MVEAVKSSQAVGAQGALSDERKARIEDLFADKDVTTQRMQRIPATHVYDGVLLGVGVGAGASAVSYMKANPVHVAGELLNDHILMKVKDGNFAEALAKAPEWLQGVFSNDGALEAFAKQHQNFGTIQGIQKQLVDVVGRADEKTVKSLAYNLLNGNEKNVQTAMNILGLEAQQLDAIKAGIGELNNHGAMKVFSEQAEQQINSNVITKLPPVQWVAENLGGNWKNKLGAVAAVTAVTVGTAIVVNSIMNRGKQEERAELKSHLNSLNERIAKEQEQLGIVTR